MRALSSRDVSYGWINFSSTDARASRWGQPLMADLHTPPPQHTPCVCCVLICTSLVICTLKVCVAEGKAGLSVHVLTRKT